jgi:hypothetical protein
LNAKCRIKLSEQLKIKAFSASCSISKMLCSCHQEIVEHGRGEKNISNYVNGQIFNVWQSLEKSFHRNNHSDAFFSPVAVL